MEMAVSDDQGRRRRAESWIIAYTCKRLAAGKWVRSRPLPEENNRTNNALIA